MQNNYTVQNHGYTGDSYCALHFVGTDRGLNINIATCNIDVHNIGIKKE